MAIPSAPRCEIRRLVMHVKSFNKEIGALGELVKSLPQFTMGNTQAQAREIEDLIDAESTISGVVSNHLTKAYRASKVRDAVMQSDQAFSTLIYALSNATYLRYIGDSLKPNTSPGLARENYILNNDYGAPLRQSKRWLPRQAYQDYIEVSLNNQWVAEQAKIDERRAFASKYLNQAHLSQPHIRDVDTTAGDGREKGAFRDRGLDRIVYEFPRLVFYASALRDIASKERVK